VSGLVEDLDEPAYSFLVSTLLLDVARSHPLHLPGTGMFCTMLWLALTSFLPWFGVCHDCIKKYLDSVVMTTWAKSRISHGLLVVECWLTDPSADVVLILIVLLITCPWT
jgi:hypothetical protein